MFNFDKLGNHISDFANQTFVWLDNFGHDHWGFILAVMFFLLVGNGVLNGMVSAFWIIWDCTYPVRTSLSIHRDLRKMRKRLSPAVFEKARSDDGAGIRNAGDLVRNIGAQEVASETWHASRDSGRTDLSSASHRASSQAGLASIPREHMGWPRKDYPDRNN